MYYWDLNNSLPSTRDLLSEYQETIIGSRYYKDAKSLQWNNYLYFIRENDFLSEADNQPAIELVERDRDYARKFVISENDLKKSLKPASFKPSNDTSHANIFSTWIQLLEKCGLYDAIFGDHNLPKRLKLIESYEQTDQEIRTPSSTKSELSNIPFIESLQLDEYRPHPLQEAFNFGTVNLIVGNNGAGKTSLLEAIELYYCGRNKRNKNSPAPYAFRVTPKGSEIRSVSNIRTLQSFRDNNLNWYGQPETNTNNLYLSFSQFNFLDTDAAVGLATTTTGMKDNLSKLLIGSEASKTWKNIQIVKDAVESEIKNRKAHRNLIAEELTELKEKCEQAKRVKKESDIICTKLKEILSRNNWHIASESKNDLSENIIKHTSEILPILKNISSLDWLDSPITFRSLDLYLEKHKNTSHEAKQLLQQLNITETKLRTSKNSLQNANSARKHLEEAQKIVNAGIFENSRLSEQFKESISRESKLLLGSENFEFEILKILKIEGSLAKIYEETNSSLTIHNDSITNLQSEYKIFVKAQDETNELAQQLRQIASRILKHQIDPDDCPLCHTKFEKDQLEIQMKHGVDEKLEMAAQELFTKIEKEKNSLKELTNVEAALKFLVRFRERSGLDENLSIQSILTEIAITKSTLKEAKESLSSLNLNISSLNSQGISISRLEEIVSELDDLDYSLKELSKRALDNLQNSLDSEISSLSAAKNTLDDEAMSLESRIGTLLEEVETDSKTLTDALSRILNNIETISSLKNRLSTKDLKSFSRPNEKTIREFCIEIEAAEEIASKLQSTIQRETVSDQFIIDSINRISKLEPELESLKLRMKRFEEVKETLEEITDKHSLDSAMAKAQSESGDIIKNIFTRIHAPAEFEDIGSNWNDLVRKNGEIAKLSEISTGQRAAFALSVFLSQNAQLTNAPPVILIDDPIAHIDDLNALSFLDYLRDLSLGGDRQIFFATASNKLASLFERKFDFLGDQFCRFDLNRN